MRPPDRFLPPRGGALGAGLGGLRGRRRLRRLVDGERRERGLQPLTYRGDLDGEAAAHADRMAREGELFHNDDLFTTETKRRLGAKRSVGAPAGSRGVAGATA